jgi:hypothetical protein
MVLDSGFVRERTSTEQAQAQPFYSPGTASVSWVKKRKSHSAVLLFSSLAFLYSRLLRSGDRLGEYKTF